MHPPKWIFQALEDNYELNAELTVGKKVCWESAAHWDNPFRIGEDQNVIFFQTSAREFHGLGEVIGVGTCKLGNPKHSASIGVDVLYTEKFSPKIPVPSSIPTLTWDDNRIPLVLTEGFTGTNFPISGRDWANLKGILPRL
jgi:hypothetical protein